MEEYAELAGKKGRSGRPSNAERQQCLNLIAGAISNADWQEIFRELALRAKSGSVAHMKVLFAYAFGVPVESEGSEQSSEPINIIEVFGALQRQMEEKGK